MSYEDYLGWTETYIFIHGNSTMYPSSLYLTTFPGSVHAADSKTCSWDVKHNILNFDVWIWLVRHWLLYSTREFITAPYPVHPWEKGESFQLLFCIFEHDLYRLCLWTLNDMCDGSHTKPISQMEQSRAEPSANCSRRNWWFWNDLSEKDSIKKQIFGAKLTLLLHVLVPPFLFEYRCYSALRVHG